MPVDGDVCRNGGGESRLATLLDDHGGRVGSTWWAKLKFARLGACGDLHDTTSASNLGLPASRLNAHNSAAEPYPPACALACGWRRRPHGPIRRHDRARRGETCLMQENKPADEGWLPVLGRPLHPPEQVLVAQHQATVVHHRRFGRNQTAYDPWHYVPVLARKPGDLRNGAPFKDWPLPAPFRARAAQAEGHR